VLRAALIALCEQTPGGVTAVADEAGLSAESLTQVIKGYTLKSGRPRGLGPASRRKLSARFPGWLMASGLPSPVETGGGVAHSVSLDMLTIVPTMKWGELMNAPLPRVFKVALPDNAMAPRAPAGAMVEFTTGIDPRPGDGVLITDQAGNVYFREFRERRIGAWEAHALNPTYGPLDSMADGLKVVAVLTGVSTRWYM